MPTTTLPAPIEANQEYLFTKSGSRVLALAPSKPYLGQQMWCVRRVDTGKEMCCPALSLQRIESAQA